MRIFAKLHAIPTRSFFFCPIRNLQNVLKVNELGLPKGRSYFKEIYFLFKNNDYFKLLKYSKTNAAICCVVQHVQGTVLSHPVFNDLQFSGLGPPVHCERG